MSAWIARKYRSPRHNQWVVVPFGDGFKAGQYDSKHPFCPCVVDRHSGKFYRGFEYWKPLTAPKERKSDKD